MRQHAVFLVVWENRMLTHGGSVGEQCPSFRS